MQILKEQNVKVEKVLAAFQPSSLTSVVKLAFTKVIYCCLLHT